VAEIRAAELLSHAKLFGMRMAGAVKPGALIETVAFNDQGVTIPVAD